MRGCLEMLLVLVLGTCGLVLAADGKTNDTVIFKPTENWQVVEKGTPLPPGLHIRYNVQTGVTEAKLMDKEESKEKSEKSLTLHPEKAFPEEENDEETKEKPSISNLKIPLDELKSMLKKMKYDEADELVEAANKRVNSAVPKGFGSYSEIKEQFEKLSRSMNISTDAEVLTSLIENFEPHKEIITSDNLDTKKVEDILNILDDMEYLLHQIDNAQLFADLDGMSKVISPSLNSTNQDIKAEALRVLGAAVQLNPKVQLKALGNDFVQKILYMLTTNNKILIKSRCLFALGALIRNFPAAQKTFINSGGLEIFGKILVDGNSQIQIRIMRLINDLAIERYNLQKIEDKQQKLRRKKELDSMNFENKLVTQKYCQNLVDLALKSLRVKFGIEDFHGTIFESLITLSLYCKDDLEYNNEELLTEIQKMLNLYREYPNTNEDGENLNLRNQELLEKLQKILTGEEEVHHDEL